MSLAVLAGLLGISLRMNLGKGSGDGDKPLPNLFVTPAAKINKIMHMLIDELLPANYGKEDKDIRSFRG